MGRLISRPSLLRQSVSAAIDHLQRQTQVLAAPAHGVTGVAPGMVGHAVQGPVVVAEEGELRLPPWCAVRRGSATAKGAQVRAFDLDLLDVLLQDAAHQQGRAST